MAVKRKKVPASKKYADGTTYKDSEGRTHKRISKPGTKRGDAYCCLLYTSPSPRDRTRSRMPSSA